jgi:ankyrin repeat protein
LALLSKRDKAGLGSLHWAAFCGYERVVQQLLEKGADVAGKDRYGLTALSQAAMEGREAVVELLLEKGADVECKHNNGWTPLWWAAKKGHEAVVKLLSVLQVTEARLVNTLTSTSLTSRSRVISALGRYNQKCGVVEKECLDCLTYKFRPCC